MTLALDLTPAVTLSRGGPTISARVFESLRQAIVQQLLRPGDSLSEADVARQLGVSRQPVREAFIKLAEVGLLDVRPQRGTYVMLISLREVENARFLRDAIEVAIARKAALLAEAADVAALQDLIGAQRSVKEGDTAAFLRLDDAFHQRVARSADCEHAWRVLENLKAQMDRVRYLSLPEATPLDTIVSQHVAVVEAIAAADPKAAERAMRLHLGEILNSLPKLAERYPALFCP